MITIIMNVLFFRAERYSIGRRSRGRQTTSTSSCVPRSSSTWGAHGRLRRRSPGGCPLNFGIATRPGQPSRAQRVCERRKRLGRSGASPQAGAAPAGARRWGGRRWAPAPPGPRHPRSLANLGFAPRKGMPGKDLRRRRGLPTVFHLANLARAKPCQAVPDRARTCHRHSGLPCPAGGAPRGHNSEGPLTRLGHDVVEAAKYLQWQREVVIAGVPQQVKIDVLVGSLGDARKKLNVNMPRVRPKGNIQTGDGALIYFGPACTAVTPFSSCTGYRFADRTRPR
jgi:hypothetical protein